METSDEKMVVENQILTFYCHVHPDWEGTDIGKVHDHISEKHPELFADLDREVGAVMQEYKKRLQSLVKDNLFEIPGPNRLSDQQWIQRYHGRPPKIGNLMGANETEK